MRNIIKLALVGLLSVSTIVVAAESSPEALRIGYQKGSIGMVLAKSHQLLEKRYPQSKISWVEFPAGPQMLEALNVGSIDLGSTGDIPPIFAQAAGADLLYVGVEPPKPKAAFARTDSVGQQRMAALHNGKRDNLEISPNLWAGVGLVRGGAGTALVGDGPTVAARINEYAALGIDSFVLSGYPHLEEAYRVGELLFPHLDVAIPEIPQPQPLNPQGEAVENDFIPRRVAQS